METVQQNGRFTIFSRDQAFLLKSACIGYRGQSLKINLYILTTPIFTFFHDKIKVNKKC